MLDYVILELNLCHDPFGEAHMIQKADGRENTFRHRVAISAEFPWTNLHVQSRRSGEVIRIEGSPASYLQGQNMFGSNNVEALVRMCAADVLSRLKIPFTKKTL